MEQTTYPALRPLLLSIAYRLLGSFSDAEDVVQEAFLRLHREAGSITSARAFLVTVTTRLAVDQLRSARRRREVSAGPWLPEPAVDEYVELADQVALLDTVSTAFLLMLERLSADQRAVFVLHEVFGYSYQEVAPMLRKTPAACRQVAVRARRRVQQAQVRFEASPAERDELARRFLAACREGQLQQLVELLAPEATFTGDGGTDGKGLPRPVVGAYRVARVLSGGFDKLARAAVSVEPVHVGGQPGLRMADQQGRTVAVWSLLICDGRVVAVHGVSDPRKLGHLAARRLSVVPATAQPSVRER